MRIKTGSRDRLYQIDSHGLETRPVRFMYVSYHGPHPHSMTYPSFRYSMRTPYSVYDSGLILFEGSGVRSCCVYAMLVLGLRGLVSPAVMPAPAALLVL